MSYREELEPIFKKGTVVVVWVLCSFALTHCSSIDLIQVNPEPRASRDKAYYSTIERYSSVETEFEGFENSFQFRSTFNNSEVRKAVIGKMADYYQWEPTKVSTELEKATQENSSESQFFLSFFTPERKNDNLADSQSIWRILLDVGGQRFVGKAKKYKAHTTELIALYPYHAKWNSAYIITFPVAARMIETQNAKITVTGPLGAKTIEIQAVK